MVPSTGCRYFGPTKTAEGNASAYATISHCGAKKIQGWAVF